MQERTAERRLAAAGGGGKAAAAAASWRRPATGLQCHSGAAVPSQCSHQNSWPQEQPCTVAGFSGGLWRQMTHLCCSAVIVL